MDKLKMILKDNKFIRHTFFIVFNAILLYILYFLINLPQNRSRSCCRTGTQLHK